MSKRRTKADALTIAYIAIGVRDFMSTPAFRKRTVQPELGELEFVQSVIDHALMLDRKSDRVATEFTGVYVYDVAEEFGRRLSEALITEGESAHKRAKQLAKELIASACN